jgi:CheY-like chemotaxis protein
VNARRAVSRAGVAENRLILLVDDDSNDRWLLRRAFERAGVLNPIREIWTGAEAIAYLAGEGEFADRNKHPFPAILLLDLNMPGASGFDVLKWIRDKMPRQGLLIVVLSHLDEIRAINRAYSLGANSFLTKPGDEQQLEGLIKSFRDYWLVRNTPPGPEAEEQSPP